MSEETTLSYIVSTYLFFGTTEMSILLTASLNSSFIMVNYKKVGLLYKFMVNHDKVKKNDYQMTIR